MGVALVAVVLAAVSLGDSDSDTGRTSTLVPGSAAPLPSGPDPVSARAGIGKIKHIVIVMQENRSFDSYFGTFPGADGLPRGADGRISVCLPDPQASTCAPSYHDRNDVNGGGPHREDHAIRDINGGAMDGFVRQAERARARGACTDPNAPGCRKGDSRSVMGYHDGSDLPNYWAYAKSYVLQDRMFEPNLSWSLPAHLFTVSEWSASCTSHDPSTCRASAEAPDLPTDFAPKRRPHVSHPRTRGPI